ncbi:phage portal protein [uncultured Dubosiella sp.]|uniref:phage portal protein n=3 Tax=uncultured Dubosiella sp. TaxID=1937011 RepID=UPI00272DE25E|nr:phage portal protein [uncultured Dubosiella sp.]
MDREVEMAQLLDFLGIDKNLDASAMSEATYYTCIKVLAESLGKLPLKYIQRDDRGNLTELRQKKLYHTLNARPNPYMPASLFWATIEQNRNHFGNAYVLITGAGDDQQLWILPPDQVQVWYDNARLLKDVPDVYYQYSSGGGQYLFSSDQVMHFRSGTTRDGITGIPVRESLRDTVSGAKKAQRLLNKLYSTGFTAKAVLNYTGDLSDESEKKLLRHIEAYAKGELTREGIENIIPIPIGMSLQPLNMKLTDSQYLEIKQYSAIQIASAFGIKPTQIGDYSKASYASAEAQSNAFYVDTLLYIVKQYEEEICYKMLTDEDRRSGQYVKFNIDVIMRADFASKVQALSTAVNGFLMKPNEARAKLDLGAVEGGDRLLGNGASIPIELTGSQYVEGGENHA